MGGGEIYKGPGRRVVATKVVGNTARRTSGCGFFGAPIIFSELYAQNIAETGPRETSWGQNGEYSTPEEKRRWLVGDDTPVR